MRNKIIAALAVTLSAFAAIPAHADGWSESVSACAAAAEAEGIVSAGQYRAKFVSGSGASVKKVAIELTRDNGENVNAVCKIRRGAVTEFAVTA